ncbi:MAG: hypothetical protein ACLR4Z_10280 [Butyricicoccaceae bacterium]
MRRLTAALVLLALLLTGCVLESALGRKGLHRGRRGAARRRARPRPCDLGGGAAAARRSAPSRGDRRDRSALRAACGSA